MIKQRVIAVHLLNDFSGSPFVFAQALQALGQNGYDVHLFTATPSGKGFLSGLKVEQHSLFYKWSRNKWLTLFYFLFNQIALFFKILFFCKNGDLIYINTMLPFGAALAARIKGCKVVYHIHEVSVKPELLKKYLLFIVSITAKHCVYVSNYVMDNTPIKISATVVYNALPSDFVENASLSKENEPEQFVALMLCSLKIYKGVYEFIKCAELLPQVHFILVLNANQEEIDLFFHDYALPQNIELYPAQSDVHPFYQKASIVMNLSLPDKWVETFGMTALEAMYYGKPVIVPPIGGIVELVQNGSSGFCVDARDTDLVSNFIHRLFIEEDLYERMSKEAFARANCFTQNKFSNAITGIIKNMSGINQKN